MPTHGEMPANYDSDLYRADQIKQNEWPRCKQCGHEEIQMVNGLCKDCFVDKNGVDILTERVEALEQLLSESEQERMNEQTDEK